MLYKYAYAKVSFKLSVVGVGSPLILYNGLFIDFESEKHQLMRLLNYLLPGSLAGKKWYVTCMLCLKNLSPVFF